MSDFADMHIHTTASDGSESPKKVVQLAKKAGLYGIAITDHDTIDGVQEAMDEGEKLSIKVLAGIEISLDFVRNTHLLGYFPNGYTERFRKSIKELKSYREDRAPIILDKLKKLNCPIDIEELKRESGDGVIGRPHIARVMVNKGYAKSIQDAFDRYLTSGAPAYVDKKRFKPQKAIELIVKNNGIPVLAHPITIGLETVKLFEQIHLWKEAGLMGIEVMYSTYTKEQHKLIDKLAEKENLLKTGGSDFHGTNKPKIKLGIGLGQLQIPKEYFDSIFDIKI